MRISLLIAIAAAAALAAGPGFAQNERSAHHAAEGKAAPGPHSMAGMDPAAMHEMCKTEMDRRMDPKSVHEHSGETGGMAMWPNGKPLTKKEMAKMHEHCAAKMSASMVEAPKK